MRFHRFFIREKIGENKHVIVADKDIVHQLKKVFRLKIGDKAILFDGDGFEYVSEILGFEGNVVRFHVVETGQSFTSPRTKVNLYPSLIKKDKLEWVIQKCTELGVAEFHPVISDRSEKKGFDIKRAEKIAIEAAEQSGWGKVPKIYEAGDMRHELERAENPVVLESDAPKFSAAKILGREVISVFVGPEGGWTDSEKEFFKKMKIPTVSLAGQTLRAETASVAISSLLLL